MASARGLAWSDGGKSSACDQVTDCPFQDPWNRLAISASATLHRDLVSQAVWLR